MKSLNDLDKKSQIYKRLNESYKTEASSKLIFEGVVVDIDRYGGKWTIMGRPTGPGTLKVYIPELDNSTEISNLRYFESALPSHLSISPELKEQVLVLFDSPEKNKGYWLKRLDSTSINYSEAYPSSEVDISKKIGTITENDKPYNFKETDESPDREKIPFYRKKPGDVILEGRSNSIISQTFTTKTKKGAIDIILDRKSDIDDYKNLNGIKDEEFPETKSARILITSKYNIDKNDDWKLTEKPDFGYKKMKESANKTADKNKHEEASYILMTADEYRILSKKSKFPLNNAVIGNNQEVWLCSLIDAIEQLSKVVAESSGQQITITQGYPNAVNLMAGGMAAVRQKLKQLKKEINKHHSKNIFIN